MRVTKALRLVQGQRRRAVAHLPQHGLAASGHVDDGEVAIRHRTQGNAVGRIAVLDPVPGLALPVQHPVLLQIGQQGLQGQPAEGLACLEGQLEGGAADMVHEDQQLVGIDARVLW